MYVIVPVYMYASNLYRYADTVCMYIRMYVYCMYIFIMYLC